MTSTTFSTSLEAQQAAVLLEGYHFELGGHDARQWVSLWLEFYKPGWIRDAVIEALYQGRYKSVSVRQILDLWQRRAKPIRHATHEFESAVCREFGPLNPDTKPSAALLDGQNGDTASNGSSNGQFINAQDANGQSVNGQSVNGKSLRQEPQPYQPIPPRKKPPEKPYTGRQAWRNYASGGPYVDATTASAVKGQPQTKLGESPSHGSTVTSVAAVRTLHRASTNTVSFNLAELAAVPGMTPMPSTPPDSAAFDVPSSSPSTQVNGAASDLNDESGNDEISQGKRLDNSSWREFPNVTTSTHAPADPEEALRLQRQYNGVLYASARAIQPFKPALPFSAKTLRMAQQTAVAGMSVR